jgi:hypothetical protein
MGLMYSRKKTNENNFLSVSYIFSKFVGSNKKICGVPSESTQLYFHLYGIFVESIQRL